MCVCLPVSVLPSVCQPSKAFAVEYGAERARMNEDMVSATLWCDVSCGMCWRAKLIINLVSFETLALKLRLFSQECIYANKISLFNYKEDCLNNEDILLLENYITFNNEMALNLILQKKETARSGNNISSIMHDAWFKVENGFVWRGKSVTESMPSKSVIAKLTMNNASIASHIYSVHRVFCLLPFYLNAPYSIIIDRIQKWVVLAFLLVRSITAVKPWPWPRRFEEHLNWFIFQFRHSAGTYSAQCCVHYQ